MEILSDDEVIDDQNINLEKNSDDEVIGDQNKNLDNDSDSCFVHNFDNPYGMEIQYDYTEKHPEDLSNLCIKLSKQIKKYSKILQSKNEEIKLLKHKLSKNKLISRQHNYYKKQHNFNKNKLKIFRKTSTLNVVKNDKSISNEVKNIISLFLHKRYTTYTDDQKKLIQEIFHCSPRMYKVIKRMCNNLPAISPYNHV
jgi:hypothetical protein